MGHFHATIKRRGLPSYAVVTREQSDDGTATECVCEAGELALYHDGIEAGDIDEQCPCQDCQADRDVRYARWRAEQEKAGVRL